MDNQNTTRREQHATAKESGHAAERGKPPAEEPRPRRSPLSREPRGVEKGIADADKEARTGSTEEPVRNTPPAGAWNDTSGD